ncbi:metallophosphoesterase [Candidatus Bipolaricaulota bacterium]|nr:metallophosphoesterase [Candidatus Bipolaricaulota bacterium]
MGRAFLLIAILSLPAWGWELTVAVTTDLHASLPRLDALAPILARADLVVDAGDAWEDLSRLTGKSEALAMAQRMGKLGYDAMVLGNHEMYLGPALREVTLAAPFPVVVTNLSGALPVRRWALLERNGLRILVLGLLWEEYPWSLWPGVQILDPAASVRAALDEAPAHDLFILLGHMELAEAKRVAAAAPECDLFVLGHNHLFLTEPIWVGRVPIVQAGHRGQAIGVVRLSDAGFGAYELIRPTSPAPLPAFWVPAALILVAFFFWPRS